MKHLIRAEVTWNDAHGNALGEFAQHEIPHAPYPWTTIGYLLRDDAAGISLAAEVGTTGNYRGVTFIPRGMILKVHYLNKPKKAKGLAHGKLVGAQPITNKYELGKQLSQLPLSTDKPREYEFLADTTEKATTDSPPSTE